MPRTTSRRISVSSRLRSWMPAEVSTTSATHTPSPMSPRSAPRTSSCELSRVASAR
ncbi:hypothetical protein [Streptomyces sp. CdTB01]|uniref:hypothetical protein n=1 Tax=Streptomyces sp. CdTB01 TaxID=1725411 RepID=UPI001EF0F38B|nr:hypothetical protein [Streptomyces sp. CdTB01]